MEINKANFNQVQGDEFDQIGKIFAVDLYKLFIIMKLWSCFFFLTNYNKVYGAWQNLVIIMSCSI